MEYSSWKTHKFGFCLELDHLQGDPYFLGVVHCFGKARKIYVNLPGQVYSKAGEEYWNGFIRFRVLTWKCLFQ